MLYEFEFKLRKLKRQKTQVNIHHRGGKNQNLLLPDSKQQQP